MNPSPRDLIDWLALFVLPHCERQQDHAMYMAVRDAVVAAVTQAPPKPLPAKIT